MVTRSHQTRRLAAVFAASTLVLGACSVASEIADGVDDVASDVADAIEGGGDPGGGDAGGSTDGPGGEGGDSGGAGGDNGGGADSGDAGSGGGGVPGAPTDDFASVGFNGPAMLRSSVDRLVVEVDVQEGVSANQSAIDHLVNTMRQIVDKPGGVVLAGGNTFASGETQWTTARIREVAQANRQNFSGGGTVVVYIVYLDGGFVADGEQTTAIGVAYNASEVGLFPGRWEGISLLGSDAAIERSVLVHEWGHLLGLVNIGYTSDIDHEDPGHPGHSSNKSSVMYYAIETTLIDQIFAGSPPDSFDDADLADLEGLRSGKYRP